MSAPRKTASRRRTKGEPRRRASERPKLKHRPAIPKFDPNDRLGPAYWLGNRISRFRSLTSHPLFPQMHGRLIAGMSANRLAGWVQRQVDESDPLGSGSMKMESLARKLQRYKRLLPTGTFLPQGVLERMINEAEIEIDLLQDLGALVLYQRQRIQLGHLVEQQMQMPMEQQRKEIETLSGLLAQMRDTMISLGYMPGVLPVGGTTVNVGAGGAVMIGDSQLEKMLAHHPEMVSRVLPALKELEEVDLPREMIDVTPKSESEEDES